MSRTDDPTPVKCLDCGWEGRIMDCEHSYVACPDGDVEPIDYCPECGGWVIDVKEATHIVKEVMIDKADAGSARAEAV